MFQKYCKVLFAISFTLILTTNWGHVHADENAQLIQSGEKLVKEWGDFLNVPLIFAKKVGRGITGPLWACFKINKFSELQFDIMKTNSITSPFTLIIVGTIYAEDNLKRFKVAGPFESKDSAFGFTSDMWWGGKIHSMDLKVKYIYKKKMWRLSQCSIPFENIYMKGIQSKNNVKLLQNIIKFPAQ